MQSETDSRMKDLASGFITGFIEGRKNSYLVGLLKARIGYLRQLGLSEYDLDMIMQEQYANNRDKDTHSEIEKMRKLLLV